jgi:type I restriction enzyme, R subunit
VPPFSRTVPIKFPRQGIAYDDLPDEEKELWDAIEWDEDGTTPTRVESSALNSCQDFAQNIPSLTLC